MASVKRTAFAAFCAFGVMTSPAIAQDGMNEDKCMTLIVAMSKLELAMVGKAGMTGAEARSGLESLQPGLPDDVSAQVDELKAVSRSAEGIEPGDPSHPMATGTFQKASRAYRETLKPYCPGFSLDY
ncbi:hypothetical protein [Henriciella aquimarina]|uniref:hypothetical protein n=1 Tax=Henriciella aquimarina TaxID=545261 RepID=UPI00117ABBC0|nr:hypothetical protein [Henriciella aquimarina]